MVNKDLFLYDLSIVAILKNEGPYLKEWLDYHLLAGVDHFYLYDNDSPDNQAEVAKPYVDAGLVDYFHMPGKVIQILAYNDAIKRFKFQTRYMAFIDGDEFIFPKLTGGGCIIDVVDEILSHDTNAAGLAVNWHVFGSNGQTKADYSRGVLDRFTCRAPNNWYVPQEPGKKDAQGNIHVKLILNPHRIDYFHDTPHSPLYLDKNHVINEKGGIVKGPFNNPVTAEKIVINHYHMKSLEEYNAKIKRGRPTMETDTRHHYDLITDRNEEFDDGILKYRDARQENFAFEIDYDRLARVAEALTETLPTVDDMETALTCRALSSYLQEKFPDDDYWRKCEAESIAAIVKLLDKMSMNEAQLFILEVPKLWHLPYPVVNDLRGEFIQCVPKILDEMHLRRMWSDYVNLDSLQYLLKHKE